jgi:hypothetical protein
MAIPKLCLLVIIGVRADGTQELVSLADGGCCSGGLRAPNPAVGRCFRQQGLAPRCGQGGHDVDGESSVSLLRHAQLANVFVAPRNSDPEMAAVHRCAPRIRKFRCASVLTTDVLPPVGSRRLVPGATQHRTPDILSVCSEWPDELDQVMRPPQHFPCTASAHCSRTRPFRLRREPEYHDCNHDI